MPDKDAANWKLLHDKMLPLVGEALGAGKGDVGKMHAVWDFVFGKAGDQDHAAAIKAMTPLKVLIDAAAEVRRTQAEQEIPRGAARDPIATKKNAVELKAKVDAVKAAVETFPDRKAEVEGYVANARQPTHR